MEDGSTITAGIVGSNYTQGMDVRLRLFCVCVFLSGSGLAMGDPPSKGSYRLSKVKKLK
jgi:hypothetical protein